MILHTVYPQAVAWTVGPVEIRWYGLIIAISVLAGFLITLHTYKKKQVDTTHVYNLFFLIAVLGIIGGRIGHVIGEWGYYRHHASEVSSIWHGGLAIHGVLFGALLAVWAYSRWRKLSFWALTDLLVVAVPIMQAIGRWGNYFNQELYGWPTSSGWGIPIELPFREPGYEMYAYFHPLFLYESALMVLVFGVVFWLWKRANLKTGALTAIYFMLFSVVRFGLDFVRLHKPMLGPLSETQWLSIMLFLTAAGLVMFFYRPARIR